MTCFMYILLCSDNSYYTGSTKDLDKRLRDHQFGLGSNHTRKYGPVELIYFEEFDRIDFAFYREKQIQGWSRSKKEALIENRKNDLKMLAECRNKTHFSLSRLDKQDD
jgi:putative endonuclease